MADTLKVIGQAVPAAASLTDLYAVPVATSTTVSTVVVCNQNATVALYRLSVAPAGAVDATSQYLAFDVALQGNNSHVWTFGLTLATTDVVRVRSNIGLVSFAAFGVEVT